MKLIVDTNRIIAALIKNSLCRHVITHTTTELFTVHLAIQEIDKYVPLIIDKSSLSESEIRIILDKILAKMIILDDSIINPHMPEAKKIMDKIDPADTPFIAAALAVKSDIWSDDTHFDKQSKIKIWKTKDLIT
ncbi:MAG TPA: PIN domain-containing protein [Candidatus Nanoarchaeia archaeon]|nr:PIN domain-containing protein [Candidatus Nanoarchaeia archaeon]